MQEKQMVKPPSGLSNTAKKWWKMLQNEFEIDDSAGFLVLESALKAFDRAEQAREIIAAEGLTIEDRFGQRKAHPAVAIERDARAGLFAALRLLRLDPDTEDEPANWRGESGRRALAEIRRNAAM